MVDPTKISQLLDMGFDQKTLKALLDNVQHTEKTADDAGVRFKETQTPAAPKELEVVIGGVTYTAKTAELAPAATQTVTETTTTVETTADVLDLDLPTFRNELKAAFSDAVAPLVAQLETATKELRTAQTVKEAQQSSAVTNEMTALKTQIADATRRLAELEGDRTTLQQGLVASAADGTVTTKAANLAEGSKPEQLSPIDDVLAWTRQAIPQAIGAMPPSTT